MSVLNTIRTTLAQHIFGQDELIESLLIALLANGHVLVEGMPWLAKTMTIRLLSQLVWLDHKRIQFTPDLLPSDITGTMIYDPKTTSFITKHGPLFTNLVLADEINRAPAKVQSALLEAMAEKQVTIWEQTHILPVPFLVMATQNPIEQQGTYQLPEAQMDRFLMKILLDYPSPDAELAMMQQTSWPAELQPCVTIDQIIYAQQQVRTITVSEEIMIYARNIVIATRKSKDYLEQEYISYGASPRWSLALISCARAYAYLQDRDFVIPEDIKAVALRVLRHRVIPAYQAMIDNMSVDTMVGSIVEQIDIV